MKSLLPITLYKRVTVGCRAPTFVAAILLAAASPAGAADVSIADGTNPWTDTSGANNVTLLGSATLGADNIVNTLTIGSTANSKVLSPNGSADSVTITSGTLNFTNNVTFSAANVDFIFGTSTASTTTAVINQNNGQFDGTDLIYANGLTKNGGGVFNISKDQSLSLSGTITVNAGTLLLNGEQNAKLSTSSGLVVNGGIFRIYGNNNNAVVSTVTLNGGNILRDTFNRPTSLSASSFALKAGNVTVNLTGTGSLVKSTVGTVILSATNTYTGATSVDGGVLRVAAGGALSGTSGISVSTGATLENANGSSITQALTLAEGAALLTSAAGSAFAPTSLTITGDASNGWTPISLTSSAGNGLIKGGALILTINGLTSTNYSLTTGSAFSGAFSSASINGYTLSTSDSGATFTGSGGGFSYLFTNGAGNLAVSVVPEPGTCSILLGAGLLVLAQRSRRRLKA